MAATLALRLVALGYTEVYWYRFGHEAWEAAGLPHTELDVGLVGLRRSELVGLDVGHIQQDGTGLRVLITRSKTDKAGEGAEIGIARGEQEETCPVRALRAWLKASSIHSGPLSGKSRTWAPCPPSASIQTPSGRFSDVMQPLQASRAR